MRGSWTASSNSATGVADVGVDIFFQMQVAPHNRSRRAWQRRRLLRSGWRAVVIPILWLQHVAPPPELADRIARHGSEP
jgi:hypothetical protein